MEWMYRLGEIDNAAARVWSEVRGNGPADVWAFEGEMGAGKTTFIHALCRQLGVKGGLSSPSFSIINEYAAADGPVYHIDLYRCADEEEAVRAGVEECIFSGRPCFVEWPSRAPGLFPPGTVRVYLEEMEGSLRKLLVHAGPGPGGP